MSEQRFRYVLVGGGMAAAAAIKGIRSIDRTTPIALIGEERVCPYHRPALSKGLWFGMAMADALGPKLSQQVQPLLGTRATALRIADQVVETTGGPVAYERLLLATGSTVRRLPGSDKRALYFRSFDDYQALRRRVAGGLATDIVGSGLLAAELAAGVRQVGGTVTLHHRGEHPCDRLLPPALAAELASSLAGIGVRCVAGREAVRCEGKGLESEVGFADGSTVASASPVVCIGSTPRVELAAAVGLAIGVGIRVGAGMVSSVANVFAAGDVAEYWCPALASYVASPHEETASIGGITAGQAMAGRIMTYDAVPYFYSTIGELALEGVGTTDARLHTHVARRGRDAVCYYLDGADRVRGILFWNGRPDIEAAKQLIGQPYRFGRQSDAAHG